MSAILHVFTIHHGILHGMGHQMVVRLLLTTELLVTLSAAERFITRFRGLVNLNYTQMGRARKFRAIPKPRIAISAVISAQSGSMICKVKKSEMGLVCRFHWRQMSIWGREDAAGG